MNEFLSQLAPVLIDLIKALGVLGIAYLQSKLLHLKSNKQEKIQE